MWWWAVKDIVLFWLDRIWLNQPIRTQLNLPFVSNRTAGGVQHKHVSLDIFTILSHYLFCTLMSLHKEMLVRIAFLAFGNIAFQLFWLGVASASVRSCLTWTSQLVLLAVRNSHQSHLLCLITRGVSRLSYCRIINETLCWIFFTGGRVFQINIIEWVWISSALKKEFKVVLCERKLDFYLRFIVSGVGGSQKL